MLTKRHTYINHSCGRRLLSFNTFFTALPGSHACAPFPYSTPFLNIGTHLQAKMRAVVDQWYASLLASASHTFPVRPQPHRECVLASAWRRESAAERLSACRKPTAAQTTTQVRSWGQPAAV
jgi:hypothetical protein